jgi:cell division septal protein FtsQ
MSAVAAPADRRFRRAHVKPSRTKRRWSGRMKAAIRSMAILLFAAYGLYVGGAAVTHADALRVDRVVIRGNERLSEGEVLAVLSGLRGESLLWTDLDGWRDRLLASPWVRDAALRRSLPSTVEVVIGERQPIGISRVRNDMYLVDERGEIIDTFGPHYADLDLPLIDGLAVVGAGGDVTSDAGRAELAARVAGALRTNPDVAQRLSQIDVRDVHNAKVILSGDAAVISLGEEQFLERLENYLELAPTLRDRIDDIDHIDVRFDNRIYVRPVKQAKNGAAARRELRR